MLKESVCILIWSRNIWIIKFIYAMFFGNHFWIKERIIVGETILIFEKNWGSGSFIRTNNGDSCFLFKNDWRQISKECGNK